MISGGRRRPILMFSNLAGCLRACRRSRLLRSAAVAVCALLVIGMPATARAAMPGAAYRFSPNHGPVGTEISIFGKVPVSERSTIETPPHWLFFDGLQHGEWLILVATASTFHIDSHWNLTATFQVPATGYFRNGTRLQAASVGRYDLEFPCHACGIGEFLITSSSLAPTGSPVQFLWIVGVSLLACGLGLINLTRRATPAPPA